MTYPEKCLFIFSPPLLPKGYDFPFLRSSRLYEVCGNATGFSWTTQLVGGKALAVCNREYSSDISVHENVGLPLFCSKK